MIRDRNRQIYTRAAEHELAKADDALRSYMQANFSGQPVPMRPAVRQLFEKKRPGLIYFLTCDVDGFPIKIGYTTDLESRVIKLQTALPYEIVVLATEPGDIEKDRGLRVIVFPHLRLRGDWFKRDPELMEYIQICGRHSMQGIQQEQKSTKAA